MKKYTYILIALAVWIANIGKLHAVTTNSPIQIYVVSDEKIDDGKYIDMQDFHQIGWIAAKPDFVITQLTGVKIISKREYAASLDKGGNMIRKQLPDRPALKIEFHSEDGEKFQEFTENNIGRRIVLMLDDVPLIAPIISAPASPQGFSITLGEHSDLYKIKDKLDKLCKEGVPKAKI